MFNLFSGKLSWSPEEPDFKSLGESVYRWLIYISGGILAVLILTVAISIMKGF